MSTIKKKAAKKPAKTRSKVKDAAKKAVKKTARKKSSARKGTKKIVVKNAALTSSFGGPMHSPEGGGGAGAAAEKTLYFQARIFGETDSSADSPDRDYIVEYYDSASATWTTAIASTPSAHTEYRTLIELSSTAIATDPIAAFFDQLLTDGGFPAVRLMMIPEEADADPVMVSGAWQLSVIDELGSMLCDFGNFWIVDAVSPEVAAEGGERGGAGAGAASTVTTYCVARPDAGTVFHHPIWAAVNEPYSFKTYDPATMSVLIVPKGTTAEDLETITILQNQIDTLQTQFDLLTAQHTALLTVVTSKEAENTALRTELESTKDEVDSLNGIIDLDGAESATIEEVYTHLVNEVKSASDALTTSGYKLDNMSFNLKTFATNDASGAVEVKLVNTKMAQTSKGEAVSVLSFDIVSNTTPVTLFTDSQIPNLLGLTETVARMRLQRFGLKLKPIYQTTTDPSISIGQSFRQSPDPGTTITAGETVTVIFSKD